MRRTSERLAATACVHEHSLQLSLCSVSSLQDPGSTRARPGHTQTPGRCLSPVLPFSRLKECWTFCHLSEDEGKARSHFLSGAVQELAFSIMTSPTGITSLAHINSKAAMDVWMASEGPRVLIQESVGWVGSHGRGQRRSPALTARAEASATPAVLTATYAHLLLSAQEKFKFLIFKIFFL